MGPSYRYCLFSKIRGSRRVNKIKQLSGVEGAQNPGSRARVHLQLDTTYLPVYRRLGVHKLEVQLVTLTGKSYTANDTEPGFRHKETKSTCYTQL